MSTHLIEWTSWTRPWAEARRPVLSFWPRPDTLVLAISQDQGSWSQSLAETRGLDLGLWLRPGVLVSTFGRDRSLLSWSLGESNVLLSLTRFCWGWIWLSYPGLEFGFDGLVVCNLSSVFPCAFPKQEIFELELQDSIIVKEGQHIWIYLINGIFDRTYTNEKYVKSVVCFWTQL